MSGFYKDSHHVYRCGAFSQFTWLEHGFGTRQSGAWTAEYPPVTLRQVHSDVVRDAAGLSDRECEGDALIAHEPGVRIGVRTADCVPILLADPVTRSVAAVHAGWRGTASAIVARAVEMLADRFGAKPAHIHAAIGPAIRVCCYEVGPEVTGRFLALFPEWDPAARPNHLDLVEANQRWLQSTGVMPGHIHDSGLCTACRLDEFFSYRRQPQDPGRLVSAVERTR